MPTLAPNEAISVEQAMRTCAPELTAEREQVQASVQEMRARWERDRFIPPDERNLEALLRRRIAEIDRQRWNVSVLSSMPTGLF